jgi:hypothetical protein
MEGDRSTCPIIIVWERGGSRIRTGAILIQSSDFLIGYRFRRRTGVTSAP